MRLAITRPASEGARLQRTLEALGHSVILCPMMKIVERSQLLDFNGVQALLATSANGVRALANATPSRALPVYAVGPATAQAARQAGFARVETAGGDSRALAAFVAERLKPQGGRLLHAAGSVTAGDLKGMLEAKGFEVDRRILYEAVPVTRLPDTLKASLRAGEVDGVLFFSPRTAKIFAERVNAEGLAGQLGGARAYCLSQAVAEAAGALSFLRVEVAAAPEEDALLASIVV